MIIFDSVFCVQSYSLKLMKLVSTHRLLWPHWSRIQEFLSKKEQMVRKILLHDQDANFIIAFSCFFSYFSRQKQLKTVSKHTVLTNVLKL